VVSRPPRALLLVTSSGGVLLDLLALRPWWERFERQWVAVPAVDTTESLVGEEVLWQDEVGIGHPVAFAGATRRARRLLVSRRFDVVVSAGTGLAVPWFSVARTMGVPCTWVETLNLVGEPGKSAAICQRLATRVLVQRPELVGDRRRAAFVGELY
jgi:hypothetical protein